MMLSQLRRGHPSQDFDRASMSARTFNNSFEQWKYSERPILPDSYPMRSNSSILHPDLSRPLTVDAYLLAIIRIEDRGNHDYRAEVLAKLRQKDQTHSFINKPCSLCVIDHVFFIHDRMSQTTAEKIPVENLDPTCIESEKSLTLNDIFMYRLRERPSHLLNNSSHSTYSQEHMSTVVVFKCSNRQSKLLTETILNAAAKQLRQPRSARSESRNRPGPMYAPPPTVMPLSEPPRMNPSRPKPQHYKNLTEELNKCFDDIELFVHYLEGITGYTRELERSRRKGKKGTAPSGKFPEDKYFIDVLQKFKHSFNLIGELKQIIYNPNGPDLIHYLLSPLQFILVTLNQRHPNQTQLARTIWNPPLAKDARELLSNCLTSREHEILKNLGAAWSPSSSSNDEMTARATDYKPIFFNGSAPWENENDPISARSPARMNPSRMEGNNNGVRQSSPSVDRSLREQPSEIYNQNAQNEHAWAITRKQAGAKICAVKIDRMGQNAKELTVRRGELIEILDDTKNWWRAKNFLGAVGHVPHNIVEEVDIERHATKMPSSNPSVALPRSSSVPMRVHPPAQDYHHYLPRSPSNGNNFIFQSNHSTSTRPQITGQEFFQGSGFSNPSSMVPAAPPLPPSMSAVPPPPPLPPQFSSQPNSPWSTLQMPNSSRSDRPRSQVNGNTPRQEKLQQELAQRINDRVGVINPNSTKDDVQRWLGSKQISPELIYSLRNFNGDKLFQLTEQDLERMSNPTQASRLYALLLQQKQLAGYPIGDASDRSASQSNFGFNSLRATNDRDRNGSFRLRSNDSLSRSLKMKLKERRDKIEQAETTPPIVL